MLSSRTLFFVQGVIWWLLSVCHTPSAFAQSRNFDVLWGASSGTPQDGETWDTWRDWQALVDLGNTGIQRDRAVFLYQSDFGLYPYAGLHRVALDPQWTEQHHARMAARIDDLIPDPAFSGLAIIDYEVWGFSWGTTSNEPNTAGGPSDLDYDFKDDWRDYVRQNLPWTIEGLSAEEQETVFASLYDAQARDFVLDTLHFARSLRPNARWGFYGIPYRSYYDAQDPTAAAVYGSHLAHELGWLYETQDAFYPDVYSLYLTQELGQQSQAYRDDTISFVNYVTYNIQWAMDAARGKPVYPLVWMRYHENAGPFAGQPVNATNMQFPIRLARQMSANGVVIWDSFGSTLQANRYQAFVDNHLRPFLRPFLDRCPGDFNGDQTVDIDDLLEYLDAFERGNLSADCAGTDGAAPPNYVVEIDDLVGFLVRFIDGC